MTPTCILLVDDHPLVRDALHSLVASLFPDGRVLEAQEGTEALAEAAQCPPQLAILDLNLPDQNGLQLARRLRVQHPEIRLLFVAGAADPWTVREALKLGRSGYALKTNPANVLSQAILTVLAGRSFLCPASAHAWEQASLAGPAAGEPPGPAILSPREREVLQLLACGQTTKAIALELGIGPKTVETHRQHVMRKLKLNNLADLTSYAIRHGLRPA